MLDKKRTVLVLIWFCRGFVCKRPGPLGHSGNWVNGDIYGPDNHQNPMITRENRCLTRASAATKNQPKLAAPNKGTRWAVRPLKGEAHVPLFAVGTFV